MERVLALQTLPAVAAKAAEPGTAASSDSNACSSESTAICSAQSIGCRDHVAQDW